MARFYREEMQWLNGTGWVDKAHGIAHIPIADAMRKVAQENIPGWPGRRSRPSRARMLLLRPRQPSSPMRRRRRFQVASIDGETP